MAADVERHPQELPLSAIAITVQTLLANAGIVALVKDRVYPYEAPQAAAPEQIVINLVSEDEEVLLQGASEWPRSRVSVECRALSGAKADRIGEAVKNALRNKHLYAIAGFEVTFTKDGTDVTDTSNVTSTSGLASVSRRVIDFNVRWRTATP